MHKLLRERVAVKNDDCDDSVALGVLDADRHAKELATFLCAFVTVAAGSMPATNLREDTFQTTSRSSRDVAVLSSTVVDVVLSTVPSFAHHVVGTHSRRGTGSRRAGRRRLLFLVARE